MKEKFVKRHAGVPLIVLILLIVCAAGALVWMARSMVPEPFVVTLPRVGVDGNKMVDGENNIVTLRGVSIADPYYLDHYDHHFSEEIFAELSTWNINVVRVPIHPGWWQAEEDYARKYLDPVVSWGKKYEFYIVLDWHAIGDPLTGEAQNPEWKEEGYTVYNPSLELAGNAWTELAKRYGENSWVIFELFNEPTSWWRTVDWESWGDEITKLVDKIRSYAPDTLILVSGWRWTNDLGGFLEYPIERANIAYVAHVYPDSQEKRFDFLSGAHPVVVTEWGFSPADPAKHFYGSREGFGQPFLEYLESENLSWVAWVFHPIWGPNMIKDWGYELTEQGNLVKQVLTPDNTPPIVSIGTPPDGSTVKGSVRIVGTVEDDIGLSKVEISIGDGPYQPVSNVFDSSYRWDNWSYDWDTLIVPNGNYAITVGAADLSGNTFTDSITVVVDNPIDETPPTASIEAPSDGATVSGEVMVSGTASDENGIREIRVCIDNVDRTCWVSSEKDRLGLFSQASIDDGGWSLSWDTTKVSDGAHTITVRAMDNFGNLNDDSISVKVVNGSLLGDCESEFNWSCYAGGGGWIEISSDDGAEGNAIKVAYDRDDGWWGIVKGTYRDFSTFSGIEFWLKGNPNHVRIQLEDSGGELWVHTLSPPEDWKKITIPFDDLTWRVDYQHSWATRNQDLELDAILSIQFIHTIEDQEGTFWIDEFRLY